MPCASFALRTARRHGLSLVCFLESHCSVVFREGPVVPSAPFRAGGKRSSSSVRIVKADLAMKVDEEFDGQSIEEIAEGEFGSSLLNGEH